MEHLPSLAKPQESIMSMSLKALCPRVTGCLSRGLMRGTGTQTRRDSHGPRRWLCMEEGVRASRGLTYGALPFLGRFYGFLTDQVLIAG
jgi:hypothetical protein